MKRTPEEIDHMTPREAFAAGEAFGREELAAGMRADEAAAHAAETIEAKKALDDRLASIERRLKAREDDAEDRAKAVAGHARRIAALEGEAP